MMQEATPSEMGSVLRRRAGECRAESHKKKFVSAERAWFCRMANDLEAAATMLAGLDPPKPPSRLYADGKGMPDLKPSGLR